ncbi:MAG: bifunctional diaminohydroxyphosphoribosylaminopyrimidine deaminase/5-amino-6-(5-phosphoribosylamino)uracil reductase RibD [Kiritimatiellia bacterium]
MLSTADTNYLWRALELAKQGEGHTRPNPPVGAVIVKDGKIVGEGWHRRAGGDHAEVAAIKRARVPLTGATLYVTLEPCSKAGRVGACTDAIAAAGLARVVYAVADPNPKNRGKAKRALAKAGIACVRAGRAVCEPAEWAACGGLKACLAQAERLIAPFAKHVTTGLPYVTVKLAMSLDGKICDRTGNAKWISSAVSRRNVGWERTRIDAIMVGAETVRRDDPSLRSHNAPNDDLIRVVVTRSGRLPKRAQIFTDGRNPTLVYRADGTGRGFLRRVLSDLGRRGVMHVLCEGGLQLATALADAGLVDRWIAITCPLVIGSRPLGRARRFRLYEDGFSDPVAGDREGRYVCLPE